MRAIAIVPFLSMLVSASAFAQAAGPTTEQAADEPQTLVGGRPDGPTHVTGWFVAPAIATTGFGGQLAYAPGIRGGVYLNRRLALGAAVNGLGEDDTSFARHESRNFGAYGGLLVQYVIQSNGVLHATLESTLGTGHWYALAADGGGQDVTRGRRFLFCEPMANLELNVARHVRIATGVGYRLAVAGAGDGPSSADMSSLVVRTSLVLGSF
jgi:hypothetical protein